MAGLKGILDWLWHGARQQQRSALSDPDYLLTQALQVQSTSAGVSVSWQSAMRLSAVSACVRLIAESIASLPLHVYRRVDDKRRQLATDDPLYRMLHSEPNRLMSGFVFRETLAAHVLLNGNAYAWIVRDQRGNVLELLPVNPLTVTVLKTAGGELAYTFTLLDSHVMYRVSQWDMLHIPGLAFDGIKGLSPIRYAAESLGLAIAAEQYGGSFFGNGSTPSGFISLPGKLNKEQADLLRQQWQSVYGGVSNGNKTAVLFEGGKFEKISIPPNEAQFIETRKFQVNEIARWYRVPPHMIGDLERATFSNIEHQALDYVTHTLRPWLVRFEQEFNRKLFPTSADGLPSDLYAEFNVDGLLRGDVKSRADYYVKGRQWGWLSANDIREMENMEPIAAGDDYLTPLNMQAAGTPAPAAPGAQEEDQ